MKSSIYEGDDRHELAKEITVTEARRYLYCLIIDNAKENSDLSLIQEVDSSRESNPASEEEKLESALQNLVNSDIFDHNVPQEQQSS